VTPYNKFDGTGDGFSFHNFNAHEMKDAVLLALDAYRDRDAMNGLIRRAMEADFGFEKSAEEYARLYIWML
jgi:starch synthase